jgi:hypothetical protein
MKCGRINKVRKMPNKPMYIERCECGEVASIFAKVFKNNHGEVVEFVQTGSLSWL